jgi:hypothetical protein
VASNADWDAIFSTGDPVVAHDAWSAIERLALMVAGEPIEFAVGSLRTDGFDTIASAVVFTERRLVELAEVTLRPGGVTKIPAVVSRSRADLQTVTLTHLDGEAATPQAVRLRLRYGTRESPLEIDSRGHQMGEMAPFAEFLPSLLLDMSR